jgi:hypothetical protein
LERFEVEEKTHPLKETYLNEFKVGLMYVW